MIRGPWAEAIISIASHSQTQKVKDTSASDKKAAVADSEPPPQYSFVRGRNIPPHKQGR